MSLIKKKRIHEEKGYGWRSILKKFVHDTLKCPPRYRDHCNGILQWREKWNSAPNTAWASGNLQGWGSVDGKLLRENRAKGSSGEINLAGFLLKKSQDN